MAPSEIRIGRNFGAIRQVNSIQFAACNPADWLHATVKGFDHIPDLQLFDRYFTTVCLNKATRRKASYKRSQFR